MGSVMRAVLVGMAIGCGGTGAGGSGDAALGAWHFEAAGPCAESGMPLRQLAAHPETCVEPPPSASHIDRARLSAHRTGLAFDAYRCVRDESYYAGTPTRDLARECVCSQFVALVRLRVGLDASVPAGSLYAIPDADLRALCSP